MEHKNIETKVEAEDYKILSFFCIDNADNIVGCGWYNSKYCAKSCKFYKKMVGDKDETKR